MYDPIFYLDTAATGVIISCQYFMIKSSFSAWRHINDKVFGNCIKRFVAWVAIGTAAGAWIAFSHLVLR